MISSYLEYDSTEITERTPTIIGDWSRDSYQSCPSKEIVWRPSNPAMRILGFCPRRNITAQDDY